ncbi:MAG TPA: carbamate kinase [Atribacterota bacterium]|nr:carbamate kinase [Atribacterota bacterium]HOR42134.1 carbamate kinase [Atribacterota bacterium]
MADIILIALGGNAIKQADEKGSSEEQFKNCYKTTAYISNIIKNLSPEDRLVITHGNGPQVGNLMVQQKAAQDIVPAHPMDVVGAMTQGQIGYMLQQTLMNHFKEQRINKSVCAVLNQVLVDRNDPEFEGENASKPVGNFLTAEEARELKNKQPDYIIKKVKPNGERCWRRVVPSPDPISNLDGEVINKLVDAGVVVIASGGGGIPVLEDENGQLKGVEAVIDKDLAGERLAEIIGANILFVLTDVEKAKINFGQPDEQELGKITYEAARKYYEEGQFLAGSMGPKVMACLRFIENGGEKAIISSLDKVLEAYRGETGTIIEK